MKKILILGAGVYQVPLIKAAKEMGLYTIVSSIPGNYPGFEIADKVYYENTRDYDKILEIARAEEIDGIVTACTDVAVITVGKVCDALGLPGLSAESAEASSHKSVMKECYEKFGVRSAKYRKIPYDEKDIPARLEGMEFPMIVKSIDSSGSRGITRIDSFDELDGAIANAKENTRADHFLIEEFIEGKEFGAQAFVKNGKLEFVLPHGDYLVWESTWVPKGHYAPFELNQEIIDDAREQLALSVKAMGLDNCALNADFIAKDGKAYVLEVGGRAGGACLSDLVSIYYGYNYYEKILKVAMGQDVTFEACDGTPADEYEGVPNACMMLTSDIDGVLVSQENLNDPDDPDILDIRFDCKPGDEVSKFRVSPDRIGHVITKGETLEQAVDKLNSALEKIHIEIREK